MSTTHDCPHCDRTFARERFRDLHLREHEGRLTEAERAAYREAREAEDAALRRLQLKAVAALVVLYFGLLIAFAVVP